MKKAIKLTLILGFIFLVTGFISALFFHDLSLIERLRSAITIMSTVGFAEYQIQGPPVFGIICAISGLAAFLLFFVAIILFIVRLIIKIAVKEIEDAKIKSV